MKNKDPYKILGVSNSATQDEIKRAYRRLAKEYHPDRNPGNKSAEQRFKEVQAAYEVLGDPQRRAQYDRFGSGGPAPEFRTWRTGHTPEDVDISFDFGSMGDLSSIFEQFFRRSSGPRAASHGVPRGRAPKGADIEHSVTIGFEEAVRGTHREVVLQGADGQEEHIRVQIPAGVSDGQLVRVRGRGQAGPGGRGDLLIRCQILPHPRFRRHGLDLELDLPLSFPQAALGTTVDVPTLEGTVRLKVPAGTSSGARLRLRGRGVHDPRSGNTGDLFAIVRIEVPRELSTRARQLIEQLEAELRPAGQPASSGPA